MASIESTRAVVDSGETYDGKIIPTEKAEIGRPVKIREDATVLGSIYGGTVQVGSATVEGSIMAADSVTLEGGTVHGELGTDGKIVTEDATVYGTVTGQRVRLSETIVYGNVIGTNVILENCAVIGLVVGERELVSEGSLCYTFKSYGTAELTDTSIVLPQAIAEGELKLQSPVTVTGLGRLEIPGTELPTMDEADLVETDGSTYLSLAPRILNLRTVSDRLTELETLLEEIVTASARTEVPPAAKLLDRLGVEESAYPDVLDP